MTKLQELVSNKLENNELTELEKCLINERIGLCECQCGTCPIGALGYGTIGCLEMKNASPLFGKDIDDACYKDIDLEGEK